MRHGETSYPSLRALHQSWNWCVSGGGFLRILFGWRPGSSLPPAVPFIGDHREGPPLGDLGPQSLKNHFNVPSHVLGKTWSVQRTAAEVQRPLLSYLQGRRGPGTSRRPRVVVTQGYMVQSHLSVKSRSSHIPQDLSKATAGVLDQSHYNACAASKHSVSRFHAKI